MAAPLAVELVGLVDMQILSDDLQQVRAALSDVVRQKLNAVKACHSKKGVVPLFKVGLPVLEFNGSQLACSMRPRKLPLPHAGSRKRESMRPHP
jgi:hypothetical protein